VTGAVNLPMMRNRLQWFGYVEHKDDTDWVKATYVDGHWGNSGDGMSTEDLVKLCQSGYGEFWRV